MKKISIIILTLVLCGVCKAHVENYQSSNILSAQEAKYILEHYCPLKSINNSLKHA